MKFYWIFLVLISWQSLPFLEALKLVDNGYENLYVVIQENIHESEELLDRIQDIFKEASTVLYIATHRRAYFKTLKVIIPKSWTKKDHYKTVSGLNSLTSHVKIGDSVNLIPPHTVGSGACGQAGFYLYLPLDEFVMPEGTTAWGPHAKVIVHEWGHLRWGLRDEYPTIKKPIGSNNAVNSGGGGDNVVNPGGSGENSVINTDDDGGLSKGSEVRVEFYQANSVYKPVSCSPEMTGYASMDCTSGIPDGNCDLSDTSKMIDPRCKYCPSQSQPYNISMMDRQYLDGVIEFCDEDDGKTTEYIRHNSQAENEQNLHCKGKSAWEIMREHEDFKDGNNPPMSTTYPPAVDIHWVQQSPDKARVFVLDSSGSMGSADRIAKLYNMMQIIIEDVLPDGSWVSLIDFDSYAKLLTDFVQLNSTVTRQKLVSLVPSTANGGTCIPCGLDMAIQVISDFDVFDSTEEAEVILLSDGDTNGDMEAATQRCIDAGVVVTSIAFSHHADERLVNISERTGGRLLHIADNGTVSLTAAFTDVVSGGVTTDSQSATTMMNEQVSIMVNDPLNFAFTIDDGIGKDTTVSVISKSTSTLTIQLDGPSNFQKSKTGIGVQALSLVVDGIIEQGPYIAQVTSSTAAEIEVMVTSKPTSPDTDVIRTIVRLSSNAYDFSGPSLPIMFVQLRKGESPVKKAIVKVQIENALGGKTCELELFDNGKGDDIQSGDGIYTAPLLRECQGGNGRHSSKVLITGTAETVATLYFSSKSAMIGTGVTPTTDSPTGTFERVAVGDAYTVTNYNPVIANEDITPPSRITDIQVIDIHSGLPSTSTTRNYTITWTAPGDDANVGQASFYEMRISDDPNVLRLNFLTADELNTGGSRMTPNISGKVERLLMTVSSDDSFTTTTNFAIIAVDEVGNRGPVSNIVPITVGSTSQFEVIEEECTDDCYAVLKDCGRDLTVRNGRVNLTNVLTTAGTEVPVMCNVGYELTGGTTLLCQENGTWSNTVTCEIIGCGGISIPNGGLEFPEGTNYSATAIVTCSDGYHITGSSSVTCMADGNWETPGTCEKNDCGKNETIAHGQIDFTNADTTYGQSVPVTCDTGYELFGGHTIQCLADGQWSKTVRCDIKDCESAKIANGVVDHQDGTTFGTVANITCDPGYHLVGTGTITCLETELWSSETKCDINDCGANEVIAHGHIDFTNADTTYGQTVPVTCDSGYAIIGGHTIQCLAGGQWSKTVSCVIKDCEPASIANGVADHHDGTTYGSVANITCDPGYHLEGIGTITCLETGIWSTETKCVINDCGVSFTIQNGFVNFTNVLTTFGETLPIVCDTGYKHRDGSTIRCDVGGNWKTAASCELVDCERASISDGEVTHPSGTTYSARGVVQCDTGFEMVGTGFLECLESGLWNTESQCIIRDCGTSATVANGTVDFTNASTTFGQFVPVSCNIGFRRIGGTSIECLADGTWSKSVGCELVGCGSASIANGEIQFPFGTDYNDVAFVNCDVGFHLTMDNSEIVCLPSGSWNISAQCEINDCGNNATIAHGHIDFTNADTTFGQLVSVTCNTGYDLFGGHTIQCLADGSWSKTVSCVIKDCDPPDIANGVADYHDATTYGSVANITCDPGYHLEGIGTIYCLETGIWSTETKCVINDCGRSFTIQNGFVNFTNVLTTFGETLPFVCDTGYKHQDGSTIRCDAYGKWETVASCEVVDCERAFISDGEVTHPSGTTYSARAMVQCHTGFEMVGTGFLVCLESGLWNTETQCTIRDCGRSATVANGTVDFTNASTTFGQFVPVSCNIGFRRVGGTSIECLADGTWSKSVSCELVGCGSASVANGEIQFPFGTDYNDVAFVNCDEGFHLTMDDNEIVCLPTGNWNISVRCEINDCGINATIAHGHIDFTNADTTFGQSVSVTCNTGYDLVGGHTIQCLADGSWSKTVSCVIKDCEPPDIANGEADHHDGTTYGSVANITCDPGYHLVGIGTLTCLETGIWSTETKCVIKDCGASFTFQNGFVNFTNVLTTYGEILPIVCDTGYKHKDGSTIRCDADGNWKSVASCELVDCARASTSGGEVTHPSGTKYPARAVVNCDTGYEMVGTGFLECLETGLWSTESQCVIRDCGRSATVANGTVDFTNASTTFGQFVPVNCNIGFRRIGGASIECLADGTWSKSVSCDLVGCGWASIANGEILFPFGTDYNDVAFVNCDAGFHLTMENNEIVCLPSGSWNISVQCEINDCGRNVTIQNGHANFVGLPTTYGQYIPVSCDKGYMRQGGTHILCLSDGIWSSTVTCEIVDCEHTDIANGVIDFFQGTKYNAKAKIICDFGFRVTGTGFIRCMETGRWNNDSYCSIIDCGRTATVANGSVDFTNALTTFGQSVPVSCNIGFRRIGGTSIECLADGTWSKSISCELVGCGGASIANGEIRFPNGTDYNAEAFVDCSTGFHLTQESNRIVCLHSGEWNIPVRCEINDCGSTLIIPGGRADFADGLPTTYGEYVFVTCHRGYRRQGGTHIQCLASGEWSSTVTCDIVDCGYPDISNGALDFSNGTKYNSKAKLYCNEGYRLYGTGFIECFETGRWSNHSICIIIDCGRDVTVAHGIVDFNDGISTYGHSVPVICDTGYEINGNHRIECLANGMWSSLPTCQITECDTDVEIKNGRANFTGRQTTFGVSIPVVCDAGFQLKGNESITCLANRTWSEFPVCELIDEGLFNGLKVVSIVAGSFGLIVLIIIGLLTRSFVINARTRAPGRKSKITHKQRKYMANDTIMEPPPDYDMESVDWYLYDNKKFQHFDQHYTNDIYY